jgi:hypothetical protein
MSSFIFLFGRQFLSAKLLALFCGAVFLNACSTGMAPNANFSNANSTGNINTSAKQMNANIDSNQITGEETMKRDLQVPGRFNCKKNEEVTLEFQPVATNSAINYEFVNEPNNAGIVSNDKLTFQCDKNRRLTLLFTFSGNSGKYGIVFRTKSGTVIKDEEPVVQPLSEIPETRDYDFKVLPIGG